MRDAFAAELVELASEDERIVLLMGDIGNRMFNRYRSRFPARFFNCGVAEANMASIAAGMALCGLRPVTYTIASFAVVRCLEQIRVDVCYHNLPVTIIGLGGGLPYAMDGATHCACEDIALMRALPNMTVVCPGDPWEVRQALRAAVRLEGPVYIRLGKKHEPLCSLQTGEFCIGKGLTLRQGKGDAVCLLSSGNILPVAVQAAEELASHGISARLVSFHTVKPLDDALLEEAFYRHRFVVTIEEHSTVGGFGGAVAEWLADRPPFPARMLRIGTPDDFLHVAGKQEHARKACGLTSDNIVQRILDALACAARSPADESGQPRT
jgi:transketolase